MNKIKVKIDGTEGPVGKTQLAKFLDKAVRAFDPLGVEPPHIVIRDGADRYDVKPDELGQELHAELFARIEEAGRPNNISGDILDLVAKSWDGADPERGGFAEEMAVQYGFTWLDGDANYLGVKVERLADMMSVLGYRTGKERRDERAAAEKATAALRGSEEAYIVWNADKTEGFVTTDQQLAYEVRKSSDTNCFDANGRRSDVGIAFCNAWGDQDCTMEPLTLTGVVRATEKAEPAPQPASVKTDHDPIDKLLYAYAHAASAIKVGDNLYDLPEFKAVKAAFEKARFLRNWDKIRLNSEFGKVGFVGGGLVGSGESYATVKVRNGYAGLHHILVEALNQAQQGKGAERHNLGGDIPFERQRMQQISELIGSVDGMTYQACKKITEGVELPTLDRQVAELLGAINYIAGMITFLRGREKKPVSITTKAELMGRYADSVLKQMAEELGIPAFHFERPRPLGEAWFSPVKAEKPADLSKSGMTNATVTVRPAVGKTESAVIPDDPFTAAYASVPITGWTATSVQDLFRVLAQVMTVLHEGRTSEAKQLLSRVWRLNSPFLKALAALSDKVDAAAKPANRPDECPANGQSCVMRPEGPEGELQCTHCGSEPAKPAAPHHPV